MTHLHRDFETRSAVDLKKFGAHVYAADPSTDVWCMCYAVDDGPVKTWIPGDPVPPEFVECARNPEWLAFAHNDAFERTIEREIMAPRYGWPEIPLERHRCTMAMAYAMALPGSLEQAGAAVGLDQQKDPVGHRLMLQMAKPRRVEPDGTTIWWDDLDRRQRLYAYCAQDVEAERALHKRLLALRPIEERIWQLDQRINDRGIGVDQALCEAAKKIIAATTEDLNDEIKALTGGVVGAVSQVNQLLIWLRDRGVDTASVKKDAVTDLLELDLPDDVRRVLELRQEGGKTSTAKINKLLACSSVDGRLRGSLQYHGAGTGRWAGRGAQLQNLPRPSMKVTDAVVRAIQTGDAEIVEMFYGAPLTVVSNAVRPMLVASEGHDLLSADFSNIEGRVVAWLAGDSAKIAAFRAQDDRTGPEIYLRAASQIFGVPVTSKEDPRRQIGKVSELALGFQGGPRAFVKMALNYNMRIDRQYEAITGAVPAHVLDDVEERWESFGKKSGMAKRAWIAAQCVVTPWRGGHPAIVQLWADLEAAAIEAVEQPGRIVTVGRLAYRVAGSWLFCRLPSGRCIAYPYPRIESKPLPWGGAAPGLVYKAVDQITRQWGDKSGYGGLLTENAVQAVARDVMAEAMLRVEDAGYPCVLTVHDEIVAERRTGEGSLDEFRDLMVTPPTWADGLPIVAEGWRGRRYRK